MLIRNAPWIAFGLSVAALIVAVGAWYLVPVSPDNGSVTNTDDPPVIVLVAPALRPALDPAAAEFTREFGIKIELRYGPSETLLTTNLEVAKQGDLFIPADDSYVAAARAKGLVEQHYDLARMSAVAVFHKKIGKPAEALTWDDFFRPGFRIAQPNPDVSAIGKLTRQGLTETGEWARIEKSRAVSVGTVTEAANAVNLGSADGAIVWDAIAGGFKDVKVARLPHLERVNARVTVAVCTNAKMRAQARWFAEYLSESDRGRQFFTAAGYGVPPAPKAKAHGPDADRTLVLYAGAMLRPAIEETIREFEERENAQVTRVYNGCGILVAQMRADVVPDVYLACDPRFMGDVADLFDKPEIISNNQLVIAVPKGNPNGLKGLKDLGKADLKVGVGHEQQCALGAITKETFIQSGVYAAVRKNVRVESPTGDLLVNQLLTGSLDAVVCYISNVSPNSDKLEGIPLTGIACAAPEQPIAIAKDTANPELAAKLIEAIKSRESRDRFEQLGFGWGRREPKK